MLGVGGSYLAERATGERAFSRPATEDVDRQLERSLARLSSNLQRIERLLNELQRERRSQCVGSDERAYSRGAAAPAGEPGSGTPKAETRAAGAETPAAEAKTRAENTETRVAGAVEAETLEKQPQTAAVEPALRAADSRASASEAQVRVIHGSGRSAFDSSTGSG
jgi:uncharacterized membrane protein